MEEDDDEFGFGDFNATQVETKPDPVVEKVSPEIAKAETESSKSLPNRRIRTFTEVYKSKSTLKFYIENVMPDHGIVFIGGLSGTGKTILAIQMLVNLLLNRPTMTWFPVDDLPELTGMMLSLEMSDLEWQKRVHDMYPELTPEEEKFLGERFLLYAEAEVFELWNDNHCADLIRLILMNEVNVLLIDSASVSFAEDLTDQKQVKRSLKNLDMIRIRLKVCIVIVAHAKKPVSEVAGKVEMISINDLFGITGIAQHASTIFLVYEDEQSRRQAIREGTGDKVDKLVHIVNVKTRFGSSNSAFSAILPSLESTQRGTPLQFRRKVRGAIAMGTGDRKKVKEGSSNLAEDLKNVDFNEFLEDDL